ncbi:MAG: aldo/keto reductase [Dehalococcoidia bacterium]|nr:aldo/keto reductase [Dehalococcoidia bacterium]
MDYVKLGRTGLKVSAYCVGGDNFGDQTPEAESLLLLGRAFGAGVNFIDTANSYCGGKSEEIISKFIAGRRSQVVLATKCRGKVGTGPNDIGVSRKAVMQACDDSLRRLNTEYIDLYYIHSFDPDTPLEETLRAFDDLVHQGKVRYTGCSNFNGWQLTKALWTSDRQNLARFDALQPRYNLLYRDPEREAFPAAREHGVGIVAYSPMAGGFLLGKYSKETVPSGSRFSEQFRAHQFYRRTYWNDVAFDASEKFGAVAKKHGVSRQSLALTWVRSQPGITACIVGAKDQKQLMENLAAWEERVPAEAVKEATEVGDWMRQNGPWGG